MDWQQRYRQKLATPQQAVRRIRSHSRIAVGHAAGEPLSLIEAMIQGRGRYRDLEILQMETPGPAVYARPGMEAHFRHNAVFVGEGTRDIVMAGKGDFTPIHFSQLAALFGGPLPIDVALIQVSPPDEHGYCSLGPTVDYIKEAAESAGLVLAEVNDRMPRTLGDSFLHMGRIDCAVPVSRPLPGLTRERAGPQELEAGRRCARLIRDGDTLQAGPGAACDGVLCALGQKRDLGLHSELFTEAMLDLVEQGAVNGSRKTLHPGKIVAAALAGGERLYRFADNNPSLELYPASYVDAPGVILRNRNMVSITSCMEADLMGQIAAETIGLTQVGGVGGQADFIRGAALSPGGRSIIVMASTTAEGRFSRIVPFLEEGAAVSVSRNDVDYLVTEYGVAALRGRTLRQRAKALIGIAHPAFQPGLIEEYENRFFQKFDGLPQQRAVGV